MRRVYLAFAGKILLIATIGGLFGWGWGWVRRALEWPYWTGIAGSLILGITVGVLTSNWVWRDFSQRRTDLHRGMYE